mgnify:CR=1 FL=1
MSLLNIPQAKDHSEVNNMITDIKIPQDVAMGNHTARNSIKAAHYTSCVSDVYDTTTNNHTD